MYFVDHNNRTTQFTDPRLNSQILSNILRRPSGSQTTTSTTTTTTTTSTPTATTTSTTTIVSLTTPSSSTTVTNTTNSQPVSTAAPLSPRTRVNDSDLPHGLLNESELLPKYRRDLVGKLRALRAELTALQPQSGHCRLEVSRNEVFEESYR